MGRQNEGMQGPHLAHLPQDHTDPTVLLDVVEVVSQQPLLCVQGLRG